MITIEPEPVTPVIRSKMFDNCLALYARMANEAMDEEGVGTVWQGGLRHAGAAVGIPAGYESAVMQHLERMGAAEWLERGTRSRPSRILLHDKPTEQQWLEAKPARTIDSPRVRSRVIVQAALEERIRVLEGIVFALLEDYDKKFPGAITGLNSQLFGGSTLPEVPVRDDGGGQATESIEPTSADLDLRVQERSLRVGQEQGTKDRSSEPG